MKFYNKILTVALSGALAFGGLTSCDYLDVVPENTVPAENVDYSDITTMYAPVSGVYAKLRTGGMHWVINMESVIRDGDVWSGRIDDQADMVNIGEHYRYNNAFWGFKEMWNQYYGMIKMANAALSDLEQYEAYCKTEADLKRNHSYAGEVKILRAYAYYRLVQYFGDVTILRTNEQTDLRRSTKELVYKYMLEDLDYAWNNCELKRPNQMDHMGAFTAYTARHWMAKIYLNLGQYGDVKTCTNDIISSNLFDLYPDFYNLFKTAGILCEESIMDCQSTWFGIGTGEKVDVDQFFNCAGPRIENAALNRGFGGWNFVGYLDSFQQWAAARGESVRTETSFLRGGSTTREGDEVKNPSNTQNTNCWNGKWYLPIAQIPEGRNQYGGANSVRILRYADVLLMNAEALVRLGESGDIPYNKVRTRANMPTKTGVTVNDILDERRMELCCEWGERYNDIMRTGYGLDALKAKGWTEDKQYFPLPSETIMNNPAVALDPYTE